MMLFNSNKKRKQGMVDLLDNARGELLDEAGDTGLDDFYNEVEALTDEVDDALGEGNVDDALETLNTIETDIKNLDTAIVTKNLEDEFEDYEDIVEKEIEKITYSGNKDGSSEEEGGFFTSLLNGGKKILSVIGTTKQLLWIGGGVAGMFGYKQFGSTIKDWGNRSYNTVTGWISKLFGHIDPAMNVPPVPIETPTTNEITVTYKVIEKYEGYRDTAYRDVNGWAIGYGQHSINGVSVQKGDTIDRATADQDLHNRIANARFNNLITVTLNAHQRAALYSLEHNAGPGVWDYKNGKKIINQINAGDFVGAADTWTNSGLATTNAATGKVIPELVDRRADEALAFTSTVQAEGNSTSYIA